MSLAAMQLIPLPGTAEMDCHARFPERQSTTRAAGVRTVTLREVGPVVSAAGVVAVAPVVGSAPIPGLRIRAAAAAATVVRAPIPAAGLADQASSL